jgi:EAL domain-containing protein (putative c-di-GMP-specific phosphodiesterase class I)
MVGAEALVCWDHPAYGEVPPDDFIAIAEQTGAILPLGRWIFDSACQQLKLWHTEGIAPPVLSVNVSGV